LFLRKDFFTKYARDSWLAHKKYSRSSSREIYNFSDRDDQASLLAFIQDPGDIPPWNLRETGEWRDRGGNRSLGKRLAQGRVISNYDKSEQPLKIPVVRNTADTGCSIIYTYQLEKKPGLDTRDLFGAESSAT
jgi:hypothetical protein